MDIESFRAYCLAKKGVTEEQPFGPDNLVYKVMGKMFAICGIENFDFVNLKCDPERAIELREQYDAIKPGYHMSKVHWNSVYMDAGLHPGLVTELIDHSYELIVASLTKKLQKELAEL